MMTLEEISNEEVKEAKKAKKWFIILVIAALLLAGLLIGTAMMLNKMKENMEHLPDIPQSDYSVCTDYSYGDINVY